VLRLFRHDTEEAFKIAEQIAVLDQGKLGSSWVHLPIDFCRSKSGEQLARKLWIVFCGNSEYLPVYDALDHVSQRRYHQRIGMPTCDSDVTPLSAMLKP